MSQSVRRTDSLGRAARRLAPFAVLAALNAVTFWGHYAGRLGFPWDFGMGYYPIVAFWTSAVDAGLSPQWVPFQSMGYPLALNLQSGFHYPPLQAFPLLGLPYTLRAAVGLQCAHVLLGACGAFLWLRLRLRSAPLALAGAAAFHCFGGFFSNAEHADIVRSYAFTPWLFFAYTLDGGPAAPRGPLPLRALAIPPLLYLLATGGYPSSLGAALLMLALLCSLQLAPRLRAAEERAAAWRAAAALAGLTALGLALASVHLGPAWLERAQLTRYQGAAALVRSGLWLGHLPGLFLFDESLVGPVDVSMSSAYVTLPVVALACVLPVGQLRRLAPEAGVFLLALGLLPGDRSPLFRLLIAALPPLGLSRFPSSDYRCFLALPLILAALAALQGLRDGAIAGRALALRSAAAGALLACGIASAHGHAWGAAPAMREAALLQACGAFLVGAATFALAARLRGRGGPVSWRAAALLLCLVLGDAWRVLPALRTWRDIPPDRYTGPWGRPVPETGRLPIEGRLEEPPARRPARVAPVDVMAFAWGGCLTGDYLTIDVGATRIAAREQAGRDAALESYLKEPWRPILLEPPRLASGAPVRLDAGLLARPAPPGEVEQLRYGLDAIRYGVNLRRPALLVENELYFRGWTATVAPGGPVIEAVAVEGALRGWNLPAGTYQLEARFEFPGAAAWRAASLGALAAWLLLWLRVRRRLAQDP